MPQPLLPTKIRRYREQNFYFGGFFTHIALLVLGLAGLRLFEGNTLGRISEVQLQYAGFPTTAVVHGVGENSSAECFKTEIRREWWMRILCLGVQYPYSQVVLRTSEGRQYVQNYFPTRLIGRYVDVGVLVDVIISHDRQRVVVNERKFQVVPSPTETPIADLAVITMSGFACWVGLAGLRRNLRSSLLHYRLRARGEPALALLEDFRVKRIIFNRYLIPTFGVAKQHLGLCFWDSTGKQQRIVLNNLPGHVLEAVSDLHARDLEHIYIPILYDPANPGRAVVDWVRWRRS